LGGHEKGEQPACQMGRNQHCKRMVLENGARPLLANPNTILWNT
jgi:hypothetical protein